MEEDADVFAPFIVESGIRAVIGIMMSDLDLEGLSRGELAFDEAVAERQLEQAVRLVETWHGKGDGRVEGYLASTGISTGSRRLLKAIRDEANRLSVRLSTHLCFGERDLVRQAHGCEQLEVAEEVGFLADGVVAVHCYDVNDDEIKILSASGAHLAHCPLMNQFRGEIAPIQDMRAGGMNVGLGIDNYFSDYFDVLRAGVSSARIRAHDPRILSAMEVLALGTIDAARALGLDALTGSVEIGKRADLQLVDMGRAGLTPVNDPVTTLVYHAHAKDVDTVMVDGKVLVRDAVLVEIDERLLLDEAGSAADAAWARFAERHGSYVGASPGPAH